MSYIDNQGAKYVLDILDTQRHEPINLDDIDFGLGGGSVLTGVLDGSVSSITNSTQLLRSYMFQNCLSLQEVNFPNCVSIGSYAFSHCSLLQSTSFPNCTTIGNSTFQLCTSLQSVSFPQCNSIGSYAFQKCYALMSFTVGTKTTSTCVLVNSNAFNSTPIAGYTASSNGVYGSIYVPASLLSTYQSATNWVYFSERFVGI